MKTQEAIVVHMKTQEAIVAMGTKEAIQYICRMNPIQAKKVLYAMTSLKGDQRLSDSNIPEVRKIASMYEGIILAKLAKELAAVLATEYTKQHPGVLISKKQREEYSDARYRKLYEALGHYGFDYVLTAIAHSKALAKDPANNIYVPGVHKALLAPGDSQHIWLKGLEKAGLKDMADVLVEHVYTIGHVYELVEPKLAMVFASKPVTPKEPEVPKEMTILEKRIHFIQNAPLLKDFYGTAKPVVPEGYDVAELAEGTATYALAKKDMLKESEAVLKYVEQAKLYESCLERMRTVFSEEEIQDIHEHAEHIQLIITNAW